MINHAPQDTSPFDRAKAGPNPTKEPNDTPRQTNRRTEIGDCPTTPPLSYTILQSKEKGATSMLQKYIY
jgi:hypothetical protein